MVSNRAKKIDLDVKALLAHWPAIGYDSADDEVADFYSKMEGAVSSGSGTGAGRFSFFAKKKLTDVFIFAMLLGKIDGPKEGKEDYLKNGKGRKSTINAVYFADNAKYVWMMIAVALEDTYNEDPGNSDAIIGLMKKENAGKIIEICEKYANHGIHALIQMQKDSAGSEGFLGYEKKLSELLDE